MPIQSTAIVSPVGGWNARDALDLMPETDAISLINFFPGTDTVKLRRGFSEHAIGMGTTTVETLAVHTGLDGTESLIAIANSRIYDATTVAVSGTVLKSGITEPKWSAINFRTKLIIVNGADQPQQFDGTTLSDATYTGIADDADLIHVNHFNSRLYFVEKESLSVWYGGVNNITGALVEFDLQSIFRRGGKLLYTNTWSMDSGDGLNDYLVAITSEGEGVVYTGTYPGSVTWTLVGRFNIPKPLGNRSSVNVGSDLWVITEQGIVPVSPTLFTNVGDARTGSYEKISDKIDNAFRLAAENYRANEGWEGMVYPLGQYVAFNIPVSADMIYYQYIVNSTTGAWCQFQGMNAGSWALFNNKPYFGGIAGKVYAADTGQNDDGETIPVSVQTAFTYLGDRGHLKQWQLVKPLFQATGDVMLSLGIDVDFQSQTSLAEVTVAGNTTTLWDVATWDVSPWADANIATEAWYSVRGVGRAASLKLKGAFINIDAKLSSIQYGVTIGDTL